MMIQLISVNVIVGRMLSEHRFCITIDDDTLNNGTITVRDRDTMKQVTIKINEIVDYIEERIGF